MWLAERGRAPQAIKWRRSGIAGIMSARLAMKPVGAEQPKQPNIERPGGTAEQRVSGHGARHNGYEDIWRETLQFSTKSGIANPGSIE